MWRVVALLVGVLLLAACSATIDGRAETDAAAIRDGRAATGVTGGPGNAPNGTSTTDPSMTAPTSTDLSSTDLTSTDSTSTDPTGSNATGAAPTGSATGVPSQPAPITPSTTTLELPPGFYGADTDLGYRPMTTDEFDCTPDQVSGCFGIMVFAAVGCPPGATVTVGIFDKSVDPTNPIGTATGVTPAIDAGGSQPVVIADSTGVAGQLTARVQSVTC